MVTIRSENMAPQQPSSMEEQSGELCEPESEEGEKQGTGPPSDQAHPVGYDAPDGGWGWVVLVATILVLALTLAFPSCIGIFYLDLQEEFQASNSETSWVPSIMTAVLHAGGPLCSVLVERFGCRATVMFGGVLSGFGMAVSSFSHTIVDLYITTGVITEYPCTCVPGILVDRTDQYTYVFLACSISVALSALFLMVSFYWLDSRDAAQKNSSPASGSPAKPAVNLPTDCQYSSVPTDGDKTNKPSSEAEKITNV
ncbi:monocarboxylate transporter 3-like [Sinocyclocheilus rhinocerous]|uniref:monocarboxylate transporter 3-like n=1 Tax=Sinocyclocheilus rhinocerous TaxID=307959 RepID=UPI0007B838F4|nr:PREDICTED: monocarboxylate transporter 3-like [Sinocyclocheilus rhinocerous]